MFEEATFWYWSTTVNLLFVQFNLGTIRRFKIFIQMGLPSTVVRYIELVVFSLGSLLSIPKQDVIDVIQIRRSSAGRFCEYNLPHKIAVTKNLIK